jgi:hypothetical protein
MSSDSSLDDIDCAGYPTETFQGRFAMRRVLLMGAIVFAVSLTCRADTVTIFDLNATLDNGFGTGTAGSATGTVTIDVTTGVVTALDLVASTTAASGLGATSTTFTTVDYVGEYPDPLDPTYDIQSLTGSNSLLLALPVGSLVGYDGSLVCSAVAACSGVSVYGVDISGGVYFDSGSLTPEVAATPEPSSLALLGSGVLGFAGVLRRRKRC